MTQMVWAFFELNVKLHYILSAIHSIATDGYNRFLWLLYMNINSGEAESENKLQRNVEAFPHFETDYLKDAFV